MTSRTGEPTPPESQGTRWFRFFLMVIGANVLISSLGLEMEWWGGAGIGLISGAVVNLYRGSSA